MRITQIIPSLEEQHGGPSKSVHALARTLAAHDHDVELLATHPRNVETRQGGRLALRVFHRDWPGRFCSSSGLQSHLRQATSEVIHHHSVWLRTLHYSHTTAHSLKAPLVISPRGMLSPWTLRHHRWRKSLAQALIHPGAFGAAAGWHVTSEEEARDLRALGFSQPICVAPNAVPAPSPEETAAAKAHWLDACPEVAQRPTALFYSRFHAKKRVLELIELWLAHAPANWLLLLVGIPEAFTPRELEKYVIRSSGAGRVRVFDGLGRPPPYAVSSLFLLPSHSENFGLSIAEAMASGVPVVVTDTTPWTALNDRDLGWCVPWADYASTLISALRDGPDTLLARGARAREWVLDEFSWEQSARRLERFYQQLASSPSTRPA